MVIQKLTDRLKVKVILCVVVGDAGDDLLEGFVVLGVFAVGYPFTDEVAEDAAEVLVARVGYEATAIGEHADEVCERAKVSESLHLSLHAVTLVVEPPAGAELDLTGGRCRLEASEHGSENVVILGIKGIEDGLGEAIVALEVIHEASEVLCDSEVVDRVIAGIGAELVIHFSIVVTESADVELHCPTELDVLLGTCLEHCGLEAIDLALGKLLARHTLIEGRLGVAYTVGNVLESVVGETAAVAVEERDAFLDPLNECGIILDSLCVDIGDEGILTDFDSLIGAEGRKDLGGEATESRVVLEGIGRVVGGADDLNVRALDEFLSAERGGGKKGVALLPDHRCSLLGQGFVDIKISFELEVSPMVERIADKLRHSLGELEELCVIVTVTGNKFLVYAIGAHLTPLIVIAAKEEIECVLELIVLGDLLRREVAMVIDDGKILYHGVKLLCRLIFEHKVIVNKAHSVTPSLNIEISL